MMIRKMLLLIEISIAYRGLRRRVDDIINTEYDLTAQGSKS